MIYGIIGNEAAKFTPETELKAKRVIRHLISNPQCTGVASGECPLGGIDIWAREECLKQKKPYFSFPPKHNSWEGGFKPRNIRIALKSDQVHNIVVSEYPPNYRGRRFQRCYHCNSMNHVKSGGCWTARFASQHGRLAVWHVI